MMYRVKTVNMSSMKIFNLHRLGMSVTTLKEWERKEESMCNQRNNNQKTKVKKKCLTKFFPFCFSFEKSYYLCTII
jgi:uncharacterized protein YjcR